MCIWPFFSTLFKFLSKLAVCIWPFFSTLFKFPSNLLCALMYGPPPPPAQQQHHGDLSFMFWVDIHSCLS